MIFCIRNIVFRVQNAPYVEDSTRDTPRIGHHAKTFPCSLATRQHRARSTCHLPYFSIFAKSFQNSIFDVNSRGAGAGAETEQFGMAQVDLLHFEVLPLPCASGTKLSETG